MPFLSGHNMKVPGAHSAESNPLWRGDSAGYSSLHKWAARHFEKTGTCEHCGIEKKTEWASVDQAPRRQREFWMELCRSCHWKYDGRIKNITENTKSDSFTLHPVPFVDGKLKFGRESY